MSSFAFAAPVQRLVADDPQWIAMPTKSACAFPGLACASSHSGEPEPNTRVMSPVAFVEVFSSSIFAVPTPPKSQPARV